jgi:hypothetical protein
MAKRGRPRKKRRYRRRADANGGASPDPHLNAGIDLAMNLKQQLMEAKPEVSRVAIEQLLPDLAWMASMFGHPAP